MSNPFQYFGLFASAVSDHALTLAAGCLVTVVVNLIEKHAMGGKKLPLKADIAILLVFVFFACFQAWRDQYLRVISLPPATAIQVNVPQQPAPQVQVSVPGPVVNFPQQMAYLTSQDEQLVTSAYKIGGNWVINSSCINTSPSVVAEDGSCARAVYFVNTTRNSLNQPVVELIEQENAYKKFKKDLTSEKNQSHQSYGPGEHTFGTTFSPKVDQPLDEEFRNSSKTIIFIAETNWKDGSGRHTMETCQWLQIYPEMFTSPGALAPNVTVTWNHCPKHSGLTK
jgi:hypothetical protein